MCLGHRSCVTAQWRSGSLRRRARGLASPESFLSRRHALFQLFEPVLDYNDLVRTLVFIRGFQHQEAPPIGRHVIVGKGAMGSAATGPRTEPAAWPPKTPAAVSRLQPSCGFPPGKTTRGRPGSTPVRSLLPSRSATCRPAPDTVAHTPPTAPIHSTRMPASVRRGRSQVTFRRTGSSGTAALSGRRPPPSRCQARSTG